MGKLGYPKGLVSYTNQNRVDGRPSRVLRTRVWIYGTLLLALGIGIVAGIALRSPLLVDVLRDRNALYRTQIDGSIENGFTLRLINRSGEEREVRIRVGSGPDGLALAQDPGAIRLRPGEVHTLGLALSAPAGAVRGRTDVVLVFEDPASGLRVEEETRFFGPF